MLNFRGVGFGCFFIDVVDVNKFRNWFLTLLKYTVTFFGLHRMFLCFQPHKNQPNVGIYTIRSYGNPCKITVFSITTDKHISSPKKKRLDLLPLNFNIYIYIPWSFAGLQLEGHIWEWMVQSKFLAGGNSNYVWNVHPGYLGKVSNPIWRAHMFQVGWWKNTTYVGFLIVGFDQRWKMKFGVVEYLSSLLKYVSFCKEIFSGLCILYHGKLPFTHHLLEICCYFYQQPFLSPLGGWLAPWRVHGYVLNNHGDLLFGCFQK